MSTYLYKCVQCSCPEVHTALLSDSAENLCAHCPGKLIRDWRGEAVGFARVPGGGREHRS